MKIKKVSKKPLGDDIFCIADNRFFTLWAKKRPTQNEFTEFQEAVDEFKKTVYEELKFKQILDWLVKWLNKIANFFKL